MVSLYRAMCDSCGLDLRLTCSETATAVIDFHVCVPVEEPAPSVEAALPPATAPAPTPLVAQRVVKVRPQVMGQPGPSSATYQELTPELVTAQRRARLRETRSAHRG